VFGKYALAIPPTIGGVKNNSPLKIMEVSHHYI